MIRMPDSLFRRLTLLVGCLLCWSASIPGAAAEGSPQLVLDPEGFLSEPWGIAFSPDERLVAVAGEKVVRIWNVETGELATTLRGDREENAYGNCYAVAFSPDGRELVVGVDDSGPHGSLRVYDTANWSDIKQLVAGHGAPVRRLAFSRDGKHLASAADNGQIFLWDWASRRRVGSIAPPRPDQPIYDAFAFPTGQPVLLALGAQGIKLYSVPSGRELRGASELPVELRTWLKTLYGRQFQFPHRAEPRKLDLRLDQRCWLAAGWGDADGGQRYWAAAWRRETAPDATYAGHRWMITASALSPTGRLAATADKFGEVHVWNAQTGEPRQIFRAQGEPIYEAGFDATGTQILFGTTHYRGKEWGFNHYGPPVQAFDLERRAIDSAATSEPRGETVEAAGRRLAIRRQNNRFAIACDFSDGATSEYPLRSGRTPACYTFLRTARLGVAAPVVWSDTEGSVVMIDPRTRKERRYFLGHESFVSSLSPSPDERLLLTGSTDRTMRLWSLQDYRPTGMFDFDIQDDIVMNLKAGESASRAGIRQGDRVLLFDGRPLTDIWNGLLRQEHPYRPGQQVTLRMSRNDRPFDARVTLTEGPDWESPLLNVFVTGEGEWILWTPQGYYDSSPGADRFIGWHVNRGPQRSAEFHRVQQFKKQLYRPDIIDRIIQTGDAALAIREANERRIQPPPMFDFRQTRQLAAFKPPRVVVSEPRDGLRLQTPNLTIKGRAECAGDRPVQEITVLLNGNPAKKIVPPGGGKEADFTQEVTLSPGRNRLTVIASNGATTSAPFDVTVVYEPRQQSEEALVRPNLFVLAIGISKYAQAGNGFDDLKYAHRDAEEFARLIQRQEQGKLYKSVETNLITNEDATPGKIRAGMDWLVRSVSQGDVAIVFVSAHGFRDERDAFYLATHETDLENLRSTAIRWEEIKTWLEEEFPPCKRFLFLDACHSGGVTGLKGIYDPLHDLVRPESGVVVFASSTPREKSLEHGDSQHGAFTKAVLETITDRSSDQFPQPDGDGCLYVAEVQAAIADRVKQLTGGRQHPVLPPVDRGLYLQFAFLEVTP